ncbi:MAG: hypothetical protein WKF91_21580, partial [Segetibacter sp.]
MKSLTKLSVALWVLTLSLLFFVSCKKIEVDEVQDNIKQTKSFSSDVVIKWLNMQLDMFRVPLAPGTGSQAADRALAYCGIALYESVVEGMPSYQSLSGQLNAFPQMPSAEPGKEYHWAACANAALAEMNRKLFPTTSAENKTNIDNLENTLQSAYAGEVDAATIQRSIAFGKEVATRVFAWAATDGSANVNPPYVLPVGPGLWESTPPNFPGAVFPYHSQRRQLVPGSYDGAAPAPPPVYSTAPGSEFFAMVKNV